MTATGVQRARFSGDVEMTTTSAVAVSQLSHAHRARTAAARGGTRHEPRLRAMKLAAVVCSALAGLSLAACGSAGLLGDGTSDVTSATAVAPTAPPPALPVVSRSRVAIAPVMGAPEAVSSQVGGQLSSALERQQVRVAQASEKPEYTLRGYMVATKERAGTKVSYIFDLTDGAGKRVNRIQGEEMAQGGSGANLWAALTPDMSQRISDKTATTLAATLASLSSGGGATVASAPPVGVGASLTQPTASALSRASPSMPPAGSATGSLSAVPGAATAIIPSVAGAPGDGNTSLSAAMRSELQRAGIGAAAGGQRAYSVAGKVTVGPVKDGKQSIKIDWRVTEPGGALLATVSQNNDIQAGSLDGQWGNIASDAAQGAAARIKQLIEDHRAAGASRGGSAQVGPLSKG